MAKPAATLSDNDLLKRWLARYESSKKHMSEVHEKIARYQKVVNCTYDPRALAAVDPNDPNAWKSRLFPPIAREQVEVLNAEMSVEDPAVDVKADATTFRDAGNAAKSVLNHYMKLDGLPRKRAKAHRWASKIGWAPVKVLPKVKTRCVYDDNGDPKLDESGEEIVEVVYSGPTIIPWRPDRFYPDPAAVEDEDMRWCIFESERTLEELEAAGIYDDAALVKLRKMSAPSAAEDDKRDSETEEAFKARREGVFTIREGWTRHSRCTWVAALDVMLLRDDESVHEHGEIPVSIIRLIDDEDSMFGVSIVGMVDPFQAAIHTLLNEYINAVRLKVDPPKQVDDEHDVNSGEYTLSPGKNIRASPGNKTFQVIDTVAQIDTFAIREMIGDLRELMERITGMNASVAGLGSEKTATQSAINLRQGKGRVTAMAQEANRGWARVFWLSWQYIREYPDERVLQILLKDFDGLGLPALLEADLMIHESATSEQTLQDIERQDRTTALQTAMPVLRPENIPNLDATELLIDYFKLYGYDASKLRRLVTPPTPQQQLAANPGLAGPPQQMLPPGAPAPAGPPQPADVPFAPRPEQFAMPPQQGAA